MSLSESRIKYYLIAFTPVVAVFFLIPFELYYNAREYWNWDYGIAVDFVLAGLAACVVLAAIIRGLFAFNEKSAVNLSVFLFWLGLFVLLSDVLSPLQSNLLSGDELVSTEPLVYSMVEGLILLALAAAAVRLGARSVVSLSVPLTIVLVLISAGYFGLILSTPKPAAGGSGHQTADPDIKGNVYHIVLDEMQTDAALLYMEEKGLAEDFEGFTIYKNNVSNYLYTSSSMPSYLTGTVYNGGRGGLVEWKEGFKREGLLKGLNEKGYRISMFTPLSSWSTPFAYEFLTLDDIYMEDTGIKDAKYGDFVRIWFARILPNFLSNEALSAGKGLGKTVYEFKNGSVGPATGDIPVTTPEGKEPFSTVLMLKRVIEEEKDRPQNGQYLYIHSILPHGPYVFTSECEYDPALIDKGTGAYYGQVGCAFKLVTGFIEELKRLGHYDASTIIIHADTGHGHRGFINDPGSGPVGSLDTRGDAAAQAYLDNRLGWSEDQVLSRTMALLMIKPAHSAGKVKTSELPTQLIDLYPTLAGLLGLGPVAPEARGVNLSGEGFPEKRQAFFFLYPHNENDPSEITRVDISDQKDLARARLSVAGYVRKYLVTDLEGRKEFAIGSEEGGLKFTGFSGKESYPESSLHFRWATGKKGTMVFRDTRLKEKGPVSVTFEVEPFMVNIDKEMVIKSKFSTARVRLEPGWRQYNVTLEFPGGEAPAMDIYYEESESPKALGISDESRKLSARWKRVSLEYASPGRPEEER